MKSGIMITVSGIDGKPITFDYSKAYSIKREDGCTAVYCPNDIYLTTGSPDDIESKANRAILFGL